MEWLVMKIDGMSSRGAGRGVHFDPAYMCLFAMRTPPKRVLIHNFPAFYGHTPFAQEVHIHYA